MKDFITAKERLANLEPLINNDCERDCSYVCTGCDRTFHDIKNEDELNHNQELPESLGANSGNHYCHRDCYESYWN